MKFAAAKREEQRPEQDERRCAADGCKCRSSVKLGGGWTCFVHAHAEPEDWQAITYRMNEHSWLGEFIDEIKRMDAKSQDWRGFAMQFWENSDPYCQPDPRENAVPYENRMRSEFLYRIGQLAKRPAPRLPETKHNRGGSFSNMRNPLRERLAA